MNKERGKYIAGGVALVATLTLGYTTGHNAGMVDSTVPNRDVPQCQEDEVLQGVGDFSHGLWTAYQCEHPDTLGHAQIKAQPGYTCWVERNDSTVEGYEKLCKGN